MQKFQNNFPKYQIFFKKNEIIESIKSNIITFISSPTGTGKSTQIPQYLYNEFQARILICEPRKIACESICNYINKENQNINANSNIIDIYYSNKYDVLFITENQLLNILCKDPLLTKCDILLIDEIHERTMKLDLILYYMKYFTLCENNIKRNFKLILVSATLNIKDIRNYFSEFFDYNYMGIIEQSIEYKNYIVKYLYEKKNRIIFKNDNFDFKYIKFLSTNISNIIEYEINSSGKKYQINKTILVFLPDFKSISIVKNQLEYDFRNLINIEEFSSTKKFEQQKDLIFYLEKISNNLNKINVILSTTLGETCLTFPNCDIVIDTGIKKTNKYNYFTNIYEEKIEFISKDSAIQRAGRCGRGKKKGVCYRLYTYKEYQNFRDFRFGEVEYLNIDLIILKMFQNVKTINFILNDIEKKGYLDFVSKIPINIINLIVGKLKQSFAIAKNFKITDFGKWLCQNNLDLITGSIINSLDFNFNEDKKEHKFRDYEIYRIISIVSTINSINYELFNNNIDMNDFQLHILDYDEPKIRQSSIKYYCKELTKSIINKVCYNKMYEYDEKKINEINTRYEYYKLFNELNKIYNAKFYFTINKIFQTGELMIILFFIRQYTYIKCQNHYNMTNEKYKKHNRCPGCKLAKYFYCQVYSLNEKFFQIQKNRFNKICKAINQKEITIVKNIFKNIKNYEYDLIYWNMIYLNLISKKPIEYLPYSRILKLKKEIEKVDFNKILNEIYKEYYKFYVEYSLIILNNRNILENMFIGKRYENGIKLYFSFENKVNINYNFFFDFFKEKNNKKEITCFFSLSKYVKIDEKISEMGNLYYYRNINPIFDEMKNKKLETTRQLTKLKELNADYKIETFENIGLYFFLNFLKDKLNTNDFIYFHTLLIYFYKNENIITDIKNIIKQEKESYKEILDYRQCLNKGCITLELSQGLNIKNIFDSFSNSQNLIYEIIEKNNNNNNNSLSVPYLTWLCRNKKILYKRIFTFNNKILISFQQSEEISFFLKNTNLILKTFQFDEQNSNSNHYTVYYIFFNKNDSNEYIHKTMKSYFKRTLQIKSTYIINEDETKENRIVYYYIKNVDKKIIPDNIIVGQKIDFNENNDIFYIQSKIYNSDQNYFTKFFNFCEINDIDIIKIPELNFENISYYDDTYKYQILNYSIEKFKLITEYISPTSIQLNRFAIDEIKFRSKDTFLNEDEDIYKFAKNNFCSISIIFFDNKILIYGSPENRNNLKSIIIKYFEKVIKDKVIYSIEKKEEKLALNNLIKKCRKLRIGISLTKNDFNDIKIEFRKKNLDFVKKILKGKKKINNLNPFNKICEICLEEFNNKDNNNYIQLKICGHYFCVECLKMQILNDIKYLKNIPLTCIKCKTYISNNDIFELFIEDTEDYNNLTRSLINCFMLKNKNFNWCPNFRKNCLYVYNKNNYPGKTNINCPNCLCKICLLCNEIIDLNKEHNKNCKKKLFSKLNKEDRKWLIENSKNCPICNTPYEKTNGCNHMTCIICDPQIHFCYICGTILNPIDPYIHYNNPELKCYQRLWDKIEENERNEETILNIEDEDSKSKGSFNNDLNNESQLNITREILGKINQRNNHVNANEKNKENQFRENNKSNDVDISIDYDEYFMGNN